MAFLFSYDFICSGMYEELSNPTINDITISLSQQNLLRQQERVEERVQDIDEQLCKLDSDKCVVEVCLISLTNTLSLPHLSQ
jgi:hypothetical protein